jgi:hypothetical protein
MAKLTARTLSKLSVIKFSLLAYLAAYAAGLFRGESFVLHPFGGAPGVLSGRQFLLHSREKRGRFFPIAETWASLGEAERHFTLGVLARVLVVLDFARRFLIGDAKFDRRTVLLGSAGDGRVHLRTAAHRKLNTLLHVSITEGVKGLKEDAAVVPNHCFGVLPLAR